MRQGLGRRRRYSVEDTKQRMAKSLAVAFDQFGIVEIIAGEAEHAFRQPLTQFDFLGVVEQRNLDAFDLVPVVADDGESGFQCMFERRGAPIAGQLRVEHVSKPVQDDLVAGLAQNLAIDHAVIVGRTCDAGQSSARHHDSPSALRLDKSDLRLIGIDHVVEAPGILRLPVDRYRRRRQDRRPAQFAILQASAGSVPVHLPNQRPCRAVPYPSLRRF